MSLLFDAFKADPAWEGRADVKVSLVNLVGIEIVSQDTTIDRYAPFIIATQPLRGLRDRTAADDVRFAGVTSAFTALLIHAAGKPIAYLDEFFWPLPTPNGGDIVVTWNGRYIT